MNIREKDCFIGYLLQMGEMDIYNNLRLQVLNQSFEGYKTYSPFISVLYSETVGITDEIEHVL